MPTDLIVPYVAPATRLITASSLLINRMVPECEDIFLKEQSGPEGTLTFDRKVEVARPPKKSVLRGLLSTQRRRILDGGPYIDFRHHVPSNWAHMLNNHLPLTFHIAASLGLSPRDIKALLPTNIPGYIIRALDLFGLTYLLADDDIEADLLTFEVTPWVAQRNLRHLWVRNPWPLEVIKGIAKADGRALPERVFVARKDTRRIQNQKEIEILLAAHGFSTVYAEELSAQDQIRLYLHAQVMVVVHGAALAPLLYWNSACSKSGRLRLIEIMPCGHMTGVFRVIAAQVGVEWIGVRGRIKAAYIEHAYGDPKQFARFSLDDFEVDPLAINRALTEMGI